jgi:hypothetical protein
MVDIDDDPYLNPPAIVSDEQRKWGAGDTAKRFIVEPGKQAVPVVPDLRCLLHRPHQHGSTCGRLATARVDVRANGHLVGAPDTPACYDCIMQLRRDCGDFITIREHPLSTPF